MEPCHDRLTPPDQQDSLASNAWAGSLALRLLPALLLAGLGMAALMIDMPLSRALVKGDALLAFDKVLEAVEPFGHAVAVSLLVVGIFICDVRRRGAVARVLAAALGAGLAADGIKLLVARVRPYDYNLEGGVFQSFGGILPGLLSPGGGHSFPSAHVATSMGLCVALTAMFPRGRWWFAFVTGLVALQRVETGAHFLSDALWGAAVGWAFALALFRPNPLGRWFDRLEARWPRPAGTGPGRPATGAEIAVAPGIAGESGPSLCSVAQFATRPECSPMRFDVKSLSLVIPVFNERDNIPRIDKALKPVLAALGLECEIIFVDDGSTDGSAEQLQRLAFADRRVKVVTFRRNFGQTAAMSAGIRLAAGDAIVLLDGDLQNDPGDIPMMLARLSEGYDLIHGWRKDRHDRFLDRRLPSMIANWLISKVTGFPVHDLGCTLKVIRREIAQELNLYGEMHRFIPVLAHCRGARCAEVVTRHHARQFGESKYGISRTLRVIFDLITVQFLTHYFTSPMKLFGKLGAACVGLGGCSALATLAMKIFQQIDMTGNPLLLASVFAVMLGMQFFCLGVLGEVSVRTYYESQNRASYAIRGLTNFDTTGSEAGNQSRAA